MYVYFSWCILCIYISVFLVYMCIYMCMHVMCIVCLHIRTCTYVKPAAYSPMTTLRTHTHLYMNIHTHKRILNIHTYIYIACGLPPRPRPQHVPTHIHLYRRTFLHTYKLAHTTYIGLYKTIRTRTHASLHRCIYHNTYKHVHIYNCIYHKTYTLTHTYIYTRIHIYLQQQQKNCRNEMTSQLL